MAEDKAAEHSVLGQVLRETRSLREKLRTQGHALSKWGRMLNALLDLLEEKGIASKDEVLVKVYERLRDSGALERNEESGEPT